MTLRKRILQNDTGRRALCALGALYIRFVRMTGRWQVEGGEIPEAFWRQGRPFILCFWHGRLLMMPYCWDRDIPIHMLISQHRDGQIIARTVAHFGIDTIAGSSSRGGGAALRSMVRAIRNGECIGITPDGPQGPRMRASIGVAQVARLAGVPVIPAAFSCRPRRLMASWDRFAFAFPFGRGVFVWGEPVIVPPDADESGLDAARRTIEARLNDVTDRADRLCGVAPVAPDDETGIDEKSVPENTRPERESPAARMAGGAK